MLLESATTLFTVLCMLVNVIHVQLILFLLCAVIDQLPVALTADDIEHNPQFSKLLKALTQHILPNGALATSEEDVQQVHTSVLFISYFARFLKRLPVLFFCLLAHAA